MIRAWWDSLAARRAAFVLYALALVTLTHWPRLAIASPGAIRLDIFIHAGVFGLWCVLLAMCGFFGEPLGHRNLVVSAALALAYALVDELTQGIPGLGRTVDGADLVANGTGILLALAGLWVVAALRTPRTEAP